LKSTAPAKIPFDSLVLSAVVHELQGFVGGKVQRISQPEDLTLVIGLYARGEGQLLLSVDPEFARAYFVTRRPKNPSQPPGFCAVLRSRLDQARLVAAKQVGFDRILILSFEGPTGEYRLIAELMGKHSNLIFVDESDRILAAAKVVGQSKSSRPVHPGRRYEPPPLEPRPSLLDARPEDELKGREGASPFLVRLIAAIGAEGLATVARAVREQDYRPVLSPGHGAYPLSVAALGLPEHPRESISIALEQHFSLAIPAHRASQLKQSLITQLERVLLARELALSELRQSVDAAARASRHQLMGELILAYGAALEPGATSLEAHDYEGNPIIIPLDPEKTYLENANTFFDKAKRAKGRLGLVQDQIQRLGRDREEVQTQLERVRSAERLDDLDALREEASRRRWLHSQPLPSAKKEERPYEGHRIRELIGPGGVKVLYGENATSNDYLTLRVAKPDDYWLHVRGSISAHVVIQTQRRPERIGKEALMFAAKVAVQNSPSKHSGYVPVDYTLRKYVRKPKGAPAGTALYTHEKTLHIES
jgi:predicted ribosome quality control (RQC) complex YloA/Tae2 family protein